MMKTTTLAMATLVLCSCYTPANNFRAMNEVELAAYNAELSQADQVSCIVERRTGSYVKSRMCMTNRAFQLRALGVVADVNSAQIGNGASVQAN